MTIGEKYTILGEEWKEVDYNDFYKTNNNIRICKVENLDKNHLGEDYDIRYFKKVEKNPFEDILKLIQELEPDLSSQAIYFIKDSISNICEEQLKKEKGNI